MNSIQLDFVYLIFKYKHVEDWFYEMNFIPLQNSFQNYKLFSLPETTNLELIKWLFYEIGGENTINLHDYGDQPYVHACKSNLEIAKWLYSLHHENIHIQRIFQYAYENNNLEIAQWLYYEIGRGMIIQ
jgi:hypothetical protein